MGTQLATARRDVQPSGAPGPAAAAQPAAMVLRADELLLTALAGLGEGLSIFDGELRLVACNDRYLELLALPKEFAAPGTALVDVLRFQCERGDFGGGEAGTVEYRLQHSWQRRDH